ncbi:MAG: hypothetical protein HY225_03900 [Candidatus Vogelbacteria bacterium]|nr:hypothetical protein [Candidatus Vogelbacteria bacterium]
MKFRSFESSSNAKSLARELIDHKKLSMEKKEDDQRIEEQEGAELEEMSEAGKIEQLRKAHEFAAIALEVDAIYSADIDWKIKYDLIFSEDIKDKIYTIYPSFNYYDSDTSYEDDVNAFAAAVTAKGHNLTAQGFGSLSDLQLEIYREAFYAAEKVESQFQRRLKNFIELVDTADEIYKSDISPEMKYELIIKDDGSLFDKIEASGIKFKTDALNNFVYNSQESKLGAYVRDVKEMADDLKKVLDKLAQKEEGE